MMFIEPQEFTSAKELRCHYAAVRERTMRPKNAVIQKDEVVKFIGPFTPRGWVPKVAKIEVVKVVTEAVPNRMLASKILVAVAAVMQVHPLNIIGHRRVRRYSDARNLFYYLVRKHTRLSRPAIGALLSGRDQTTVLSGERRVKENLDVWVDTIALIEQKLGITRVEL
jgi:hypothetical protein